ncbi:MAG: TlpA disulfide reductase family protein [Planctomycetota bacterium JB042]
MTFALLLALLAPAVAAAETDLAGPWRAVLRSPGGELPFTIEVAPGEDGPDAVVVNGPERIPMSSVAVRVSPEGEPGVRFAIDWFDSELDAVLADDGRTLRGRWRKTIPGGSSSLPFTAVRGDRRRFAPLPSDRPAADVAGAWDVVFVDAAGTTPARATFAVDGADVTGTFRTATGDYRYLAGDVTGDRLRLSCFDGGHAFLFDARRTEDGTLAGDFWSRDTYHATWTARRPDPAGASAVPDPWSAVALTNPTGRLRFAVDTLDGEPLRHDDPRFDGKVVVVNLFGSWCPNCHDEAPLLARWHRRYAGRGLELVGLAFEFSGDRARDEEMIRRYARRHGVDYPLALAGPSDKRRAAERLPDLTRIVAYPTTIFVGRDGLVRKIHSGWSGPATGEDHGALVSELERLVERLLAE